MPDVLFRKYRPQKFADVAEQEHVVRTLQNQLAHGSIAQVYLFSGPRGVGKTTIARLLAKTLNCEQPTGGEPCGSCGSCSDFAQGRMIDVIEIDAASQTQVEKVRENIIEGVRFAPTRGKYKIFIIDEVHMLSISSFNALLKTLEEPPKHAVFILATTELHKIPATVISRCQRFEFKRIPAPAMISRLEKLVFAEAAQVDHEVLVQIARLSEGCLRDAESLLGQTLALGEAHVTLESAALVLPVTHTLAVARMVALLARKDVDGALAALNETVAAGASVKHLHDELLEYTRAVLLQALGGNDTERFDDEILAQIKEAATLLKADGATKLLDELLAFRNRSVPSMFPQIALELAFAKFGIHDPVTATTAGIVNAGFPEPLSSRRQEGSVAPAPQPEPAVIPEPPKPLNPSSSVFSPSTSIPDTKSQIPPTVGMTQINPTPLTPSTPAETHEPPTALNRTPSDLRDKWGRCIDRAKAAGPGFGLMVSSSEFVEMKEGNIMVISFPYQMHIDKMRDPKNSKVLRDAVAEITMLDNIEFEFILAKKPVEEEEGVTDLLTAFGGSMM